MTQFLDTGNLWFSRSDKFGDKMECVMINDLIKKVPDFKEIERRKRKHLISCFHEGNKETLAFWDTYAKTDNDRRKYALRFDRQEITQIIKDKTSAISNLDIKYLVHGKVKYKNLIGASATSLQSKKVKYPAFRKEYVFAYEKEYRFDISLKNERKDFGINFHLGKSRDINFTIFINPLLENDDYIVSPLRTPYLC